MANKCTAGLRKCKDCYYFDNGWCNWKGRKTHGASTECDDGWCDPEQFKDMQGYGLEES